MTSADVLPSVTERGRVPFNDLSLQWQAIADDVRSEFEAVFAASGFSQGPFAERFEKEIAAYLGARHAIGVNSGTSALHLAMIAAGLRAGDEVLAPAHTFIATLWGALYVGAAPVLCDVEPATGCIDLADAERRITPRTRAVVPVHLYGQPANMDAVLMLAHRHNLTVIEDGAQSIGGRWGGRHLGTIGLLGCISFYPGKNLGAAGEGGLVVTDDAALADRLRSLRNHGQAERYLHDEIGYNYRLDGLQAVVLSRKLKMLDGWTAERRRLAARYTELLTGLPLELPHIVHGDHVWHLYVVRTPKRDALRVHLTARRIETGLHYPVPLHRQPCLSGFAIDRMSFPVADRWAAEGLSLPLFPGMTKAQQLQVVEAIGEFFAQ